jgi:hypothetical protein
MKTGYDDSVLELYLFETSALLGRLSAMLKDARLAHRLQRGSACRHSLTLATSAPTA